MNIKYIAILMLISMVSLAESNVQSLPSDYALEKYQAPKTVKFSKHPFTWAKLKYLRWKGREVMVTKSRPVEIPKQLPMMAPEEFIIVLEEPIIQKSESLEPEIDVIEERVLRSNTSMDQDSSHELPQQQAQFNIIPQDIDLQPAVKQAIEHDCGRNVRKYYEIWQKDPTDKYKTWQYKSWLKQCREERKAR